MPEDYFISIVIPTYNEEENVASIINRCRDVLQKCAVKYEILVVDDLSNDKTAIIARDALSNNGRLISRVIGPKSLSLSVMEGIKQSSGNVVVVMDADGSHPPELLTAFLDKLRAGYDLVIASRYVSGGSTAGFPLKRKIISRVACFIGRIVVPIKDNTSGFFCVRKSALEGVELTPRGFKIGLEIFAKAKYKSFIEVPFTFIDRKKGKSKLKSLTVFQYLRQVGELVKYKLSRILGKIYVD